MSIIEKINSNLLIIYYYTLQNIINLLISYKK